MKYNIDIQNDRMLKKMKKVLAILLAMAMVVAFAGCGKKAEDEQADTKGAASDMQYVKDKGTLVVGITDFEPMDYKD